VESFVIYRGRKHEITICYGSPGNEHDVFFVTVDMLTIAIPQFTYCIVPLICVCLNMEKPGSK